MIVPLISIPAVAADATESTDTSASNLAWSEDFQNGTLAGIMQGYTTESELAYGVGGKDSISLKINVVATAANEVVLLDIANGKFYAATINAVGTYDATTDTFTELTTEWCGISKYDPETYVKATVNGETVIGQIYTLSYYEKNKKTDFSDAPLLVQGSTSYAANTAKLFLADGAYTEARFGGRTFAKESYPKNPSVSLTDDKVLVLEANYYFGSGFASNGESRIYMNGGTVDLAMFKVSGNKVQIVKHDNAKTSTYTKNLTFNREEWVNVKFVVDFNATNPVIRCFVDDELAFVSVDTDVTSANCTSLNANKWDLYHATRWQHAGYINSREDYYVAIDDLAIYTSTDDMALKLYANDVNDADKLSDVFSQSSSTATIDSETFSDSIHQKVVKFDNTPDGNYASGNYKVGDTYYSVCVNNNAAASLSALTINEDGTANGTFTYSNTTYTFTNATINKDNFTTKIANLKVGDDTSDATFYLCTAAVRATRQGGKTNIAYPSTISPLLPAGVADVITVSADYYFDKSLAMGGMDIRMNTPYIHFFTVGSTTATDTTVTVTMHNDLIKKDNTTGAYVSTVTANNSVTISKGDWHTFTAVLDSTGSNTIITGYVDGYLVGQVTFITDLLSITTWNVGHTTRGVAVSKNSGCWYADNFAIYYGDVTSAEWKDSNVLYKENFELNSTAAKLSGNLVSTNDSTLTAKYATSGLTYAGTEYSYVTTDDNTALKLDLTADGGLKSGGNVDQNLFAQNSVITSTTADPTDVVLNVSYYLSPNSTQCFQAQILNAMNGDTSITWIGLYQIAQNQGKAYFAQFGDTNAGSVSNVQQTALPTGEWFTVSTVIHMSTGKIDVYVNGISYVEGASLKSAASSLTQINANAVIVAKMNKTNAGICVNGSTGYLCIDDISIVKGTTPAGAPEQRDGYAAGVVANGTGSGWYAPSSAVYDASLFRDEDRVVTKLSVTGATSDAEELTTPFVSINSRAYDIKVESDSFTAPSSLTLDWLTANTTYTGSISGTDDKPIYYVYVKSENKVYIYNQGGNKATESNIGKFSLTTVTLDKGNYNAKYRAMCGGSDSNIDKNFTATSAALTAAGTYVMSVDYFIPDGARGVVQSQMRTNWVELYLFDLTNGKVCKNGSTGSPVADLVIGSWNNVTMIATVKADTAVTFDIYVNGIYTHTASKSGYNTIAANDWILFKSVKPGSPAAAANYDGYVCIDNATVNAVTYNAADVVTLDKMTMTVNVMGFFGQEITSSAQKIYAPNGYAATTANDFFATFDDMLKTESTASMRLSGTATTSGLRFATWIDANRLDTLYTMVESGEIKGVRFGTLIAPMDDGYLGAGDKSLTLEDLNESGTNQNVLNVVATYGAYFDYDNDASTTHFVGSIVNIHESNMTRAFSGRGYVEITLKNGSAYRIYSDTIKTVSVADQAQATIDANIYATDSVEYNLLAQYAAYNSAN